MLFSLFYLCDFGVADAQYGCKIITLLLSCSKENPMVISRYVCYGNLILLDQSISLIRIMYALVFIKTIILLLAMIPPKQRQEAMNIHL